MKTVNFSVVIESANVVLKNVAANLRDANKEYTSISRVLKDIQRKDMLKAGYSAVFEAVGLVGGNVTPKEFFDAIPESMHGKDKKGNDFVGVWGMKKEGEEKVPVLRKVTAWTPTKLFKVLAQAQVLNK